MVAPVEGGSPGPVLVDPSQHFEEVTADLVRTVQEDTLVFGQEVDPALCL